MRATTTGWIDVDRRTLSRALEFELQWPGYVELVFSIVLVWGFGDAMSTLFAARYAGAQHEVNPWIRILLDHSPFLLLALKMAVVLSVGVVLLECRSLVERVPLWRGWLTAMVAAGAAVVLLNVYVGLVAVAAMT